MKKLANLWTIVEDPRKSELPTLYFVAFPKHEAKFWSSLGYSVRHCEESTLWIDPKYTIQNMNFAERS